MAGSLGRDPDPVPGPAREIRLPTLWRDQGGLACAVCARGDVVPGRLWTVVPDAGDTVVSAVPEAARGNQGLCALVS